MKFVKFDNIWWIYDETTPPNNATVSNLIGGRFTNKDISNLQIVEALDYSHLNWLNTIVLDNSKKYGWLDRNGIFYGCDYVLHDIQAHFIHKSTRETLEQLGWVHISKNLGGETIARYCADYKNGIMPTDAQMLYLLTRKDVNILPVYNAYVNGNRIKARIYEQNLFIEDKEQDFLP